MTRRISLSSSPKPTPLESRLSQSAPTGKSLLDSFAPDRKERFYIKDVELEVPEGWAGALQAGAIGYCFTLVRIDNREITLSPEMRKMERVTFYNQDGIEVARVEKDTGWVAGGMPKDTPSNIRGAQGRLLP
jgi:hypothetical protein